MVEKNDQTALVRRLRSGDPEAFDEAYALLRPALFGYLVRMCARRDLAEDLVQEAFIRLAKRAPELAEDTRLSCWLFAVARNLFVSQYRRYRSWCELARDENLWFMAGPDRTPFEAAAAGEAMRRVERALVRLPQPAREAIALVAGEMLTPQEAAEVVGISPEAFRQRLSRARGQLAAQVKAMEKGKGVR